MRDLLKLAEYRISLPVYAQPEGVFSEAIRHFNVRATEQLLSEPELRESMLPVVRAEFQMASNYQFVAEPPWEIPMTCFAAKGDPYVSRKHALGWGRFTNSRLQVQIREGATSPWWRTWRSSRMSSTGNCRISPGPRSRAARLGSSS